MISYNCTPPNGDGGTVHWFHSRHNHIYVVITRAPLRQAGFFLSLADSRYACDAVEVDFTCLSFRIAFGLGRLNLVRKFPGVAHTGEDTGKRQISVFLDGDVLSYTLWRPPLADCDSWRSGYIGLLDSLLGRPRYTDYDRLSIKTTIALPEKDYPATITRFLSEWKRPRWPWPWRVKRHEIEIPDGIPIPGKGDNDWDQGDDKIYSYLCASDSAQEAIDQLVLTVTKRRDAHE